MRLTELKKIIREELAAIMPHASHDDHEVEMALTDLRSIVHRASELVKRLEEDNTQELEGWIQAKITKSADYINAVYDNFMFEDDDSYHDDDCDTCGEKVAEMLGSNDPRTDKIFALISRSNLSDDAKEVMMKWMEHTDNPQAIIDYLTKSGSLSEQKSTCCGRCGHYHVKGTPCPKPYLTGKRHCRNRPR